MYPIAQRTSGERNFNQVSVSEARLDEAKPDGIIQIDAGLFLVSLALVLGWIVLFRKILENLKVVPEELVYPVQPIDKIPCKTCQFYSHNRHLPCAVHPSIALTEQAINCSDYCCQNNKSFSTSK